MKPNYWHSNNNTDGYVCRCLCGTNKNKHFLLTKLNLVQGGGLPSNWVLITAPADVTRVELTPPPAHR